MSADEQLNSLDNIQVDKENLFREESLTDLKVASIRRLVPIKIDGSDDESRDAQYIASTSIMSAHGPLPIQAPLEATSLEEALEKFPAAIKEAVQNLMEEVKEMQRQQSNRIVVPEAGAASALNQQNPNAQGGGGNILSL